MTPSTTSFDDATENFADWVREHSTQFVTGVAVVVALVGFTWFWRKNGETRAAKADAEFFAAQGPLIQGNVPAAQQQLQAVAKRFDGTAGGTEAQLLLAQTYYDQGKYQDGLNVLKNASGAPKSFTNSVRLLTAVGYEGLGKFADAAKAYEAAAADAASANEKSQIQADAARAYQAAGDNASALRIWTELSKLESQGIADEARVRVGELTAKPAS